jgi:hypothetical protein
MAEVKVELGGSMKCVVFWVLAGCTGNLTLTGSIAAQLCHVPAISSIHHQPAAHKCPGSAPDGEWFASRRAVQKLDRTPNMSMGEQQLGHSLGAGTITLPLCI